MKIVDNDKYYIFEINQLLDSTNKNIAKLKIPFTRINGQSPIMIDVTYNYKINVVYTLEIPKTSTKSDLDEIANYSWFAGEKDNLWNLPALPIQFHWLEGSVLILACLPTGNSKIVSEQIYALYEGYQENQRMHPTTLIKYYEQCQLREVAERTSWSIAFLTYSKFARCAHMKDQSNQHIANEYARAYQKWRTITAICKSHHLPFNFVTSSSKNLFQEKDIFIEEIEIKDRLYIGKYNNEKVLNITYHSHNIEQEDDSDIVLFSFVQNGYLLYQWIVYNNPASTITDQYVTDMKKRVNTRFGKMDIIHIQEKNQSFVASKTGNPYLIPSFF